MRKFVVSSLGLIWAGLMSVPVQAENVGQKLYDQTCAACHGAAAIGGFAPPLVNPQQWKSMGEKAPQYFEQVAAAGMSGPLEVQGQTYRGLIMPPQSNIAAEDLSLIINYVLKDINGIEALSSAETAAAALKSPLKHSEIRALRKSASL